MTDIPLDITSTMECAVYAHYETGNYVRSDVYLDDKEYGRALDTIVKGLSLQHVYSKIMLSVKPSQTGIPECFRDRICA